MIHPILILLGQRRKRRRNQYTIFMGHPKEEREVTNNTLQGW